MRTGEHSKEDIQCIQRPQESAKFFDCVTMKADWDVVRFALHLRSSFIVILVIDID
jgi:hypothetical protein